MNYELAREQRTALVEHLEYLLERQKTSKVPQIFVSEINHVRKTLKKMYNEATRIVGHVHKATTVDNPIV